MLRRLLLPILLPIALSIALFSTAAVRADTDDKLNRLFDLMRLQEVLRGFPEALLTGMDESEGAWSGDVTRQSVAAIAKKHFAASVLANDLRILMGRKLSAPQIDASVAFYDTDFGRKVIDLEVAAATPELTDIVETEGGRIYRELIAADAPRVDQIRRMSEALSLIDWGAAMIMNMSYAMFTALYAGPETEGGVSEDQILAMINSAMGDMRADLIRMVNAETAYTYQGLSDAEFERYLAFLESPHGLALARASLDGMRLAMIERSRAFGHDLRLLMRQRKS